MPPAANMAEAPLPAPPRAKMVAFPVPGQPAEKMAEKRRPTAPVAGASEARRASPARGLATESEEEFLRQAGVTAMLRAALLKVLEARPDEPLPFLAHYFDNLGLRSPANGGAGEPPGLLLLQQQRIGRALWHLRLAHHSQRPFVRKENPVAGNPQPLLHPKELWGLAWKAGRHAHQGSGYRTAFNNNVSVAYECLSASGRKKRPGLDGRTYSELLKRICRDGEAPEEIVSPLLRKIQCRDHEAVPFDIFRYGMLTCFVLLEFVARADALYEVLDDSGQADRRVCQAVLDTLEGALLAGDFEAPSRYLEAGSQLGPDCLALAMDRALLARKPSSAMLRDEFLEKAASLFIAKVRPVG